MEWREPSRAVAPSSAGDMAVACMAVAPLLLPMGYWLAPVAVLLAAGLAWRDRPSRMAWAGPPAVTMAVLLAFAGAELVAGLWHHVTWQDGVTEAMPLVLAAGLAATLGPAVRCLRPRLSWWWGGLALGGAGNGLWALWQAVIHGTSRANGHHEVNAILFGNMALLTGLFCLAGLGWALQQANRRFWLLVMLLGAAGGLLASALSGTRGGWLALPLATLVFYRAYLRRWPRQRRWLVVGGVALLLAGFYLTPQSGVQYRIGVAMDEAVDYLAGEPHGSVGARLEMYRGALVLIADRPWMGHGHDGYASAMSELVEQGRVASGMDRYWHAHNDLLDAWVRRGLPAMLSLLALYLLPIWYFAPRLVARDPAMGSLAVAGLLLPVTFIDFGLSYAFLAYPIGIVVYGGWLGVLVGLWDGQNRVTTAP
ncbi:O-antigen ligase [Halomonas sp. 3H]|uniref:O-antigen ligase family protein n=1 Tax=Halomonas sp. 3H TaxID=2952527 RepID=UPI0020B6D91E|nr:O-antigen ligase family protein [Halomonas sp. 3H]